MARAEIGEIVASRSGRPISGASVQVNKRAGSTATVYTAETGTATRTNPLSTDSYGRIEGWLAEGSYDLVVTANGQSYTQRFEAVRGAAGTGAVSVTDSAYGATGDGVTDDTAAIKAAVAAVSAGGTVFFPTGTYIVTPTAFVGFSSVSSNITFAGAGASSIIKFAAAATAGSAILAVNSTDVTVRDLQFDTNGVSQAQCVSPRDSSARVRITGCLFKNPKTGGVYIVGVTSDIQVYGNIFNGGGYGVLTADTSTVTRLVISENTFIGDGATGSDAIQINTPSGGASNITITNNTIYNYATTGASGMGVGVAKGTNVTIANNIISTCGLDGIHIEDNSHRVEITGNVISSCTRSGIAFQSATGSSTGITIAGNTVRLCSLTAAGASGGIVMDFAASATIKGWLINNNFVQACGNVGTANFYGIDVNVADQGVISNNIVVDSKALTRSGGIRVVSGNNLLITGNRCYDSGAAVQNHGLNLQGNQTNTRVTNNDFTGNTISAVYKGAIGTVSNLHESQNIASAAMSGNRVDLAYSGTIATDASLATHFTITVTNGTAFTISSPTNLIEGQTLTYVILNSSGGAMGVITWGAVFKLAGAFTNPASTKRRTITFGYDGVVALAIEDSRAAADI